MFSFFKFFFFIFLLSGCQSNQFFGAYRQAYRDLKADIWTTYSEDVQQVGWTGRNRELRSSPRRYCYRNLGGIDCYETPQKNSSFLLPLSLPRAAFEDAITKEPINYFMDQNGDAIFYDRDNPQSSSFSPILKEGEDFLF